ncbi:MAG TPA: hydrogenase maturation nickel metallochaperone HypA [Blastocatellia bacterium]|nr:hydrogenase maturation nickel metallochaperone HypA [Blastocatellia bacterium]
MHELSIALSIVEMAEEEARSRGVRVEAVHLRLGALSGVVKEALLFSYDLACEGTSLEGSRLVIEDVPVTIYCPACDTESTLASVQPLCCSVCDSLTPELMGGRELEIAALEIH